MTSPTNDHLDRIAKLTMTRRGTLAVAAGIAAGAMLWPAPAASQDPDEPSGFDWIFALGELIAAAAAHDGQVRGGTVYYQTPEAMIQAQTATEEVIAAIPTFRGALYTQFLVPDPGNASGATFSTNLAVTIFKLDSTDEAKMLRDVLLSAYTGRADSRKLTKDETGADGLTAYLIESTYASAGGDVPAKYIAGVMIFDTLVVAINGVAYDADPVPILGRVASAARKQLRKAELAGSTIGGLIFPQGQPEATINVIVHKGKRLVRFEEPETSQEITDLISDAGRVESFYRSNFLAQPTGESAPPVLFGQNVWKWNDPEDAKAFADNIESIFEEIDPKQNVERLFEPIDGAANSIAGTARAMAGMAASNLTQPPPGAALRAFAYYLWQAQENLRLRGIEGYWYDEINGEFWSLSVVELADVGGGYSLEEWRADPRAEGLPEDMEEIIEEITGVQPADDPSIVNTMSADEWERAWDQYYD